MFAEEQELMASWAVYWWFIVAGPGGAAWRAGWWIAIDDFPRRHRLVRRVR